MARRCADSVRAPPWLPGSLTGPPAARDLLRATRGCQEPPFDGSRVVNFAYRRVSKMSGEETNAKCPCGRVQHYVVMRHIYGAGRTRLRSRWVVAHVHWNRRRRRHLHDPRHGADSGRWKWRNTGSGHIPGCRHRGEYSACCSQPWCVVVFEGVLLCLGLTHHACYGSCRV